MHSWGFLTPQPLLLRARSLLCPSPSCHMVPWKEPFKEGVGLRDWGREKKEIELQQMKLIYFQSKGGLWLRLVERGCLGIENHCRSRQTGCSDDSHAVCACSPHRALENKHTHFCYLGNAIWEWLTAPMPQRRTSATSFQLAIFTSFFFFFLESIISLQYHMCITVKH